MSGPGKAVFLSYASQDADAAKRIAEALRAAGVEVWFDQNELVGGDAWDAKIRGQISSCALFVPIISANTQARREGYFRLEWKLAAQRTHMISDDTPFLLPVVIDDTRDADARVPAEFKGVQWTRLPGGETSAAYCTRVVKLLRAGEGAEPAPASGTPGVTIAASPRRPMSWGGKTWAVVGTLIGLGFAVIPLWKSMQRRDPHPVSQPAANPEVQRLVAQAKALLDEEPLTTRETFRTAQALCENALKLSPNDAEAWATLARANCELASNYREGGDALRAATRSQAERALQLAPDSVEARLAMATVELDLLRGDRAAVRTQLEVLLRRAPDDYRILLLLSKTEDTDQVSETAFQWLRQAEALPKGKAWAAMRQAWVYWGANRLRDSLAAVERSLAAQPLAAAYHLKLMLLRVMDDKEGALKWLRQIPPVVLREDRPASIAYHTFYFARQPEEALGVLRAVPREIFEEGRYFDLRALLAADALLMAGKTSAAEVEFRTALKVVDERLATDPRNSLLWHAKGRALFHLGDRAAAERAFKTANEMSSSTASSARIDSALLLGQIDEALGLMDQIMDRTKTRWPASLHQFKYSPVFDSLRDNPRFRQIIARGEAWLAEELGTAGLKAPATPLGGDMAGKADAKSVAVLAFANLSDDKANEYFSDGISEELLNVLARVPGLKVTARTSSFHFKGKDTPIPEIARQLGIAYVVEGSVRKQGDKVRITAQLIKAADGFHVWSDTFTRDIKDVFAVQDEIAGLIAKNLSLKLGTDSGHKMVALNPQAFELYAQARQAWSLRTPEGFARAEQMLKRSLELAPDFVRARAALIDVVQMRSFRERRAGTFGLRNLPELDQRLAEIRAVLAIDPELAEVYSTMGQTLDAKWQREEARRAYRRATELNPNYATGRQWYGMQLAELGYMDEALAELKAASELDPFSFIILDNYGWLLNLAGRNHEAVAMLDRAAALNPGFDQTARAKATALFALGRLDEARAIARSIQNSQRELDVWALGLVGLTEEAKAKLQQMEPGDVSNPFQALLCAGQREAALDALADPSGVGKGDVVDLLYQPVFDPVRADPRFIRYLEVLGVTEAHARVQAWRKAHPPEKSEGKR